MNKRPPCTETKNSAEAKRNTRETAEVHVKDLYQKSVRFILLRVKLKKVSTRSTSNFSVIFSTLLIFDYKFET